MAVLIDVNGGVQQSDACVFTAEVLVLQTVTVAIYNIDQNSDIVVVLFVLPPVLITNEHYSFMHDGHCVYIYCTVVCFMVPY